MRPAIGRLAAGESELPGSVGSFDGKRTFRPRARRVYRGRQPRTGRFELADGGTILLDEVTEIDLACKPSCCGCCRSGRSSASVRARRCWSTCACWPRPIAICGRSRRRPFREDLYYRLASCRWPCRRCAPARRYSGAGRRIFSLKRAQRLEREPCLADAASRTLLAEYHWPGNVRELENIVTRASVLATGPIRPTSCALADRSPAASAGRHAEEAAPIEPELEDMERKLIEATLEHFAGHRAKTAEALGIGMRTLSGKLKAYGYAPRARSWPRRVEQMIATMHWKLTTAVPRPPIGKICRSPAANSARALRERTQSAAFREGRW